MLRRLLGGKRASGAPPGGGAPPAFTRDFRTDFNIAWDLIHGKSPFAFCRIGDGEISLMLGKEVPQGTQAYHVDRWCAPPGLHLVGEHLRASFRHTEDRYLYGVPCRCCNPAGMAYCLEHIPEPGHRITYANLWINGNYKRMKKQLGKLRNDTVVIANERGEKAAFPFPVAAYIPFPDDCVTFWSAHGEAFLRNLDAYREARGLTFLISCGPVSEAIIHHLWTMNDQNQYIDVGSALDEYVHGRKTRPFMQKGSPYAKRCCTFD